MIKKIGKKSMIFDYFHLKITKKSLFYLSGPLYKTSKTAGIYKISVLRFATMGGKVLMVDDLWYIDFGSILSNG